MPGIAGIISKTQRDERDLDLMVAPMVHESFYATGKYVDRKTGCFLGWVCHRESFSDCQPIWNEAGNVCLVFSGEVFPDPNEMRKLRGKGQESESDNASYLVSLYEEMGLAFIDHLNGCFSGALVDLRRRKVVLFNDRYGLNRIYYHEDKDGFYFSSEAKSLLRVLPGLRRLDEMALAEKFSCGCVLQDKTLFPGISLLPGGSRWTFSQNGTLSRDRYFRPETWENLPVIGAADFYNGLKETFTRILPRYFQGGSRQAMSLTGGLDGRMIMAWANRPAGELPSYTFGSTYRDSADVKIARLIAQCCHQSHETIVAGDQFFAEFPDLAAKTVFVSDGTMDVSGSVELYVNRIARQIAPVRLTGNYGSEILRGSVALKIGSLDEGLFDPDFARAIRAARETYRAEWRGNPLSLIAFKQVPWFHYSRLSIEHSQLTLRSPYLDNDLVSLMYQAPPELIMSREPSLRLIREGNSDLAGIPTDRGIIYRPTPVIGSVQHLFQEFTARSEYAYDYGMPDWIVKVDNAFRPLRLERLLLGRHKFYHFRIWYRDQLSVHLRDILLDSNARSRSYFSGGTLDRMVNEHTQGKKNHTLSLHRALTLELTHKTLIEM